MRLCEIGEKRLIAEHIRPVLNPTRSPESVGDDCALISIDRDSWVCISTDRVPANLISFKLGLISYRELGHYLAILNISDIAAAGGQPRGLLLNLAFPPDFELRHLQELILGAKEAGEAYGAPIVGGDLSDSNEMNLVATSIGMVRREEALFRSGAKPGDRVFCSATIGISATAFAHYLYDGARSRLELNQEQETILTRHFRTPTAKVSLGRRLGKSGCCTSAMDVTDGIAQSFSEIAASSGVGIILDTASLPVDPVSKLVASYYDLDTINLVLDPAADFQLVGTVNSTHPGYDSVRSEIQIIGEVVAGEGIYLRSVSGEISRHTPRGWNYYI